MDVKVKICGLTTAESVETTCAVGADYIGFNFCAASPRFVDANEARALASGVNDRTEVVGLFVDPSDEELADVQDFVDLYQLHGGECTTRLADIKRKFGKPVIKALGVAGPEDLGAALDFEGVADILMLDAKPPRSDGATGGHGQPFDWQLLTGFHWTGAWMLAGGLNAENVASAIELTHAPMVDVSSGVEISRGVKDADMIRAFVAAAKSVDE
jgi:phosphoribosylanthranilate isomerase